MSHELPHQLPTRGEGHDRHLAHRSETVSGARVHRRRASIALAFAILCLPGALAVGGHNGLTLVGVIAVVLSAAWFIASAERSAS